MSPEDATLRTDAFSTDMSDVDNERKEMHVDLLGERMTLKAPPVPMRVSTPARPVQELSATYMEESETPAPIKVGLFQKLTAIFASPK